jgi:hypothetical protein
VFGVQLGDLRRTAGQGGRLGKNTDTTMWWSVQVKKLRPYFFLSNDLSAREGREETCVAMYKGSIKNEGQRPNIINVTVELF